MQRINLWLRGHPWVGDVALILFFVAPSSHWVLPIGRPAWVQAIVYTATVLPLLARRRYPVAATVIVLGAAWTQYFGQVWANELPVGDLAIEVVLYTLVVQGRRRPAVVAAVAGAAFYLVTVFSRVRPPSRPVAVLGILAGLGVAWLAGEFIRARRAYIAEVEQRAVWAESERRALARAAVAEERNRIARELHDVLAHSVTVMVVNAEGAMLMRHTDPAVIDRTLKTISATGRTALDELRRLLEVLPSDPADRSPQPGATELRQLVAKAAEGRAPIGLTVTGDAATLPPSAALQTYRIVQEALTNVVKHSSLTARTDVRVDVDDRWVRIEVTNADGGQTTPGLPVSGRGLAGMRERVAMFDGTFEAGSTRDGGFRVAAALRLTQQQAPVG